MPIQPTSYKTLFISEQDLKDNGIINDNVDPKIIQPVIKLVQDQYVQPILGTPLMVDLQNKIVANSLNDIEKFLLDAYIQPAMIFFCGAEGSFFNTYKFQNKGIEKMISDQSQVATLEEINAFQDRCRDKAEFYIQRLIDHLEANYTSYPAYNNSPYTIDDMHPNRRSGYQSGIYLGRNLSRIRNNNYYNYPCDCGYDNCNCNDRNYYR